MFKRLTDTIRRRPIVGWILFFAIMAGVFLLGLLAASITERRAEIATIYNNKKTDIPEFETQLPARIRDLGADGGHLFLV